MKQLDNTKYFRCDANFDYYLYADNFVAKNVATNLSANNFKLKGIVDRRYSELIMQSNEVVLCNIEYISNIQNKENCVFIICLSNGLEQEKVARELSEIGFSNIIYLPMHIRRPLDEESLLRRAYHSLLKGTLKEIGAIPQTKQKNINSGDVVIRSAETEISFWCSVDMLRTSTYEYVQKNVLPGKEGLVAKLQGISDKPITQVEEYFSLFNFLSGESTKYPIDYLNLRRINSEEQKKFLEDRKSLYSIYEEHYAFDKAFFSDSASQVEWNCNGYFNILDGLHRAIYLCSKGEKKVPITVSSIDYEKYLNFVVRDMNK